MRSMINKQRLLCLLLCVVLGASSISISFAELTNNQETKSQTAKGVVKNPEITAGVPFFYYQDLANAAKWYEQTLGLKKIVDKGWVIIFELTPSSQIGLVNASGGSLEPTSNKGALLSIETQELEAWYEKLKSVEGINMIHGIESGAKGMIEEFRMTDPEGYIVEFFRWNLPKDERVDN